MPLERVGGDFGRPEVVGRPSQNYARSHDAEKDQILRCIANVLYKLSQQMAPAVYFSKPAPLREWHGAERRNLKMCRRGTNGDMQPKRTLQASTPPGAHSGHTFDAPTGGTHSASRLKQRKSLSRLGPTGAYGCKQTRWRGPGHPHQHRRRKRAPSVCPECVPACAPECGPRGACPECMPRARARNEPSVRQECGHRVRAASWPWLQKDRCPDPRAQFI